MCQGLIYRNFLLTFVRVIMPQYFPRWIVAHVWVVYCRKYAVLNAKFHVYYYTVPSQTIFWCDRKERSDLILCAFKPSATKLQWPWVSPTTSLLQHQNAIVVNFWTACTCAFGRDRPLNNISHVVPTNTWANHVHVFARSFSPGLLLRSSLVGSYSRSQIYSDIFVLFQPVKTEVKQPFPIHNNGNETGGGWRNEICSQLFQL